MGGRQMSTLETTLVYTHRGIILSLAVSIRARARVVSFLLRKVDSSKDGVIVSLILYALQVAFADRVLPAKTSDNARTVSAGPIKLICTSNFACPRGINAKRSQPRLPAR